MIRSAIIFFSLFHAIVAICQGGDVQVRANADALFKEKRYTEALPLYSRLISLEPSDHQLNYLYGTCLLFNGDDKEKAVGYLKYAVTGDPVRPEALFWLGRAYHLNYQFQNGLEAYGKYRSTADKKLLATLPVAAFEKQCRNGQKLLGRLKEIDVRRKVEVSEDEFFRFYDLSDIGGKIVVLPEELKTSLDKKKKERTLIYLPDDKGGPIYFSSYGRDGSTGRDIYRTYVQPTGSFATPVKVPGYINTDEDEDHAFLHPDGKTFYFSSKGHNSMGGYDVFRATYDKTADVFGPPENMDFAVNTPDDDILYIVDPEHREACFASARSSAQGRLHVYRVSTSQVPLVITVLQGGYSSEIDPADKKAGIVVEDAVTRERITEVRTGADGSYILALPRSGRFRFLVECGPSGRTHVGIVDIPRSDQAQGFRQELVLTRTGDQEKLVIRNLFDQPLQGDLIALALDEIKRRARLDVSEQPVAGPVEQEHFDVLTRAGFTGEYDQETVQRLALDDARELEVKAADLEIQSSHAFALAMEAVAVAETTGKEAQRLADEAVTITDEDAKYAVMQRAVDQRMMSEEALAQARMAHRTATDLDAEKQRNRQRATSAAQLSTDISNALAQGNEDEAVGHLKTLRERIEQKQRPDQDPDPVVQAERALLEKEKETRAALQRATLSRQDEKELTDRIVQLEREKTSAKGRRLEEIDREIGRYKSDVVPLHEETKQLFDRVALLEEELYLLRGEYALKRHLAGETEPHPSSVSAGELEQLGSRIATTGTRIAALPVDERFVARLAERQEDRRSKVFDWGSPVADVVQASHAATQARERTTSGDAQKDNVRNTIVDRDDPDRADLKESDVASVPVSPVGDTTDKSKAIDGTGEADVTTSDVGIPGSLAGTEVVDRDPTAADTARITPQQIRNGDDLVVALPRNTGNNAIDAATERFILENELAEIDQLERAETDKEQRLLLQQRRQEVLIKIEEADAVEAAAQAAQEPEDEDLLWEPVDLQRVPMVFNKDTPEEDLIGKLFSEYRTHETSLKRLTDADEKAAGLHGLELMLADSLRAEMARQLMVLDLDPGQAEKILPRVARLRQIREEHLKQGERYLQERQEELMALNEVAPEDAPGVAAGTTTRADGVFRLPPADLPPADPLHDRFVHLHPDPLMVYHSEIHHRSPHVREGVARKEADISRMDALTQRIDSAHVQLSDTRRGKEYDRLSKSTDRLIDERLMIRTDLGQHSAFLTKEEWRTADDSLRRIQRDLVPLGLPPADPTLLLAKDIRSGAQKLFDQAQQTRKKADRSQDIILRDSLYRHAYGLELQALREMDRSITVHQYLLSEDHVRGETIAYEEIARRLDIVHKGELTAVQLPDIGPDTVITMAPFSTMEATPVQEATGSPAEQAVTDNIEETGTAERVAAGRQAALRTIRSSEEGLGATAQKPASAYEPLLAPEPLAIDPRKIEPVEDPALFDRLITSTREEAVALDIRAMELASRATALADSTASLKEKDRKRFEVDVLELRQLSDSLRTASLMKTQEAAELEQRERVVIQNNLLRQRLVKYYYFDPEEQTLIMQEEDASRYFQMLSRALEQQEAAREALEAASSIREVEATLRGQARIAEQDAADGKLNAVEAAERSSSLIERASLLEARADTLNSIAVRLQNVSRSNEERAAQMLRAMNQSRSEELTILERTKRRREGIDATEAPSVAGIMKPADLKPVELPGQVAQQVEAPVSRNTVLEDTTSTFEVEPVAPPVIVPEVREVVGAPEFSAPPAGRPFQMPEELVTDIFQLRPEGEKKPETILMNAELPGGIIYKVQIGAFRNAIPNETFSDMTPVMGEDAGNGLTRYTAGLFTSFDQAFRAKDMVRDRGYRDAFVVAYQNGQRISLGEAMRASRSDLASQTPASRATGQPSQNASINDVAGNVPPGRTQQDQMIQQLPVDGRTTQQQPATRSGGQVVERKPVQIAEMEGIQSTVPGQPADPGVPLRADDKADTTMVTTRSVTVPTPAEAITPFTPEEEIQQVLATYPRTSEEIVAQFKPSPGAASYYPGTGVAPARPVEMIMGLFFTVQVGVYTRPVELERLYNITPLVSELTETEKIRYSTGVYMDIEDARRRRQEIVDLGVRDAFVTSYLNGKRIPVRDARILLETHGEGILARP